MKASETETETETEAKARGSVSVSISLSLPPSVSPSVSLSCSLSLSARLAESKRMATGRAGVACRPALNTTARVVRSNTETKTEMQRKTVAARSIQTWPAARLERRSLTHRTPASGT